MVAANAATTRSMMIIRFAIGTDLRALGPGSPSWRPRPIIRPGKVVAFAIVQPHAPPGAAKELSPELHGLQMALPSDRIQETTGNPPFASLSGSHDDVVIGGSGLGGRPAG